MCGDTLPNLWTVLFDQAKCLMVTSSGWKQDRTVQMLEELEATYKCRQQFRQLAQAQATEDTCVANVTKAAGSLTPQMSKRDCQSVLGAVEERLLSSQVYQQALMQAVKTFQSDHLLMRLTQQHASIAEWLVQLEHQIQCCKIVKIEGQELFQTLHVMHP